jgi:hypothetical protein
VPRPEAARRSENSCAARTPAAAPVIPTPATAAPKSTDPAVAAPVSSSPAAIPSPGSAAAHTTTTKVRTTSDRRVIRPASSRSHRPASSSARVSRVAVSTAQMPTRTARTVPVRQTVKPPGSSSATGGPKSVRIAGLSASADSDSIPNAPSSPRYWVTTTATSAPQIVVTITVPRRT